MLVLEGSVWYRGAEHRTSYALHPEKHHNGECADSQKTAAVVIAAGALCVGVEGEENMSWLEGGEEILVLGGGNFSMLRTDPSSSSFSVTLTIKVITLVMASVYLYFTELEF